MVRLQFLLAVSLVSASTAAVAQSDPQLFPAPSYTPPTPNYTAPLPPPPSSPPTTIPGTNIVLSTTTPPAGNPGNSTTLSAGSVGPAVSNSPGQPPAPANTGVILTIPQP
jgi:hypothetical protein